jgi:hypothetical protein
MQSDMSSSAETLCRAPVASKTCTHAPSRGQAQGQGHAQLLPQHTAEIPCRNTRPQYPAAAHGRNTLPQHTALKTQHAAASTPHAARTAHSAQAQAHNAAASTPRASTRPVLGACRAHLGLVTVRVVYLSLVQARPDGEEVQATALLLHRYLRSLSLSLSFSLFLSLSLSHTHYIYIYIYIYIYRSERQISLMYSQNSPPAPYPLHSQQLLVEAQTKAHADSETD